MKYPEVRNGMVSTENQVISIIIRISAGKPTRTPGHKKVCQVKGGGKKKKIPK